MLLLVTWHLSWMQNLHLEIVHNGNHWCCHCVLAVSGLQIPWSLLPLLDWPMSLDFPPVKGFQLTQILHSVTWHISWMQIVHLEIVHNGNLQIPWSFLQLLNWPTSNISVPLSCVSAKQQTHLVCNIHMLLLVTWHLSWMHNLHLEIVHNGNHWCCHCVLAVSGLQIPWSLLPLLDWPMSLDFPPVKGFQLTQILHSVTWHISWMQIVHLEIVHNGNLQIPWSFLQLLNWPTSNISVPLSCVSAKQQTHLVCNIHMYTCKSYTIFLSSTFLQFSYIVYCNADFWAKLSVT